MNILKKSKISDNALNSRRLKNLSVVPIKNMSIINMSGVESHDKLRKGGIKTR